MAEPDLVLYGTKLSGHAHRVEALLTQLGLSYSYRDAPAEVRRSPEYRQMSPFGQIPVLVDGGRAIPDSGAILVHLARVYDRDGVWLPRDPAAEVEVQRWLAIAAGDIRFGPAMARLIVRFGKAADLAGAHQVAHELFRFMEIHLAERDWLAGERPTIADLACYPYLAVADEGSLSLDERPAIRAWIARVEAIPGFQPMPRS
jgi:glutathione S-transferase